jgi:Protein of unknown function (DUF732)
MTTSNPDDDQPATTAGACAAETMTSQISTSAPALAADQLAWSDLKSDHAELLVGRSWRSVWARAALLVLCGVMAAAAVVVVLRDQRGRPVTAPAPRVPVAVDTPPATTVFNTVVAPSAAPATPPMRADDQAFLALLARDGLPPAASIPAAVAMAADVCGAVKHGTAPDEVASWLVPPKGRFTQDQAEAFVADALRTYCPHAAME